ncbi:sigma-54-dependent Fis family transcriptional regulator [Oryzibacter oryziterrae]|uniref:sigma-54-dependent Fis family transcriptional regulator n=1 Tax=Oryzibacter oryziterrae TaxID=2766474 RepID=UPI001F1906A2|nr:sigma-54-dependent Fis family transcriptional regulator [Oryzibacter oryziterrae]
MSDGFERGFVGARRRVVSGRDVLPENLPGPILRSWQRCINQGLDLIGRPKSEPLTARELSRVIERNEKLRAAARPELDALQGDADTTGCIAILTDAHGVILDAVGNPEFADRAARVALMPGVDWAEGTSGTNAIGTALAEGAAVAVQGAQHFFEPHRMLTCSAAPIRSPYGDLMGVIDISGNADVQHLHALGLVRMAVDQIERRFFFDGTFAPYDVVQIHRDPALLGTAREGILVFEGEDLIAANRHGLQLLGLDWSDLKLAERQSLFAGSLSRLADRGEIRRPDGTVLFGQYNAAKRTSIHLTGTAPQPLQPGREEPIFDANTQAALTRAIRLLSSDIPVLIQGETGAGKEVFARAAHDNGSRKREPFIAVNCAALPESLIESELFGYEDGAFTGARKGGYKGQLRAAHGGTLFLDEIGDMPLSMQARLLRVLQEREVTPLGGTRPVAVDFNLICATHRDLSQAVERGEFRADLYFRIAQYTINLPPLRNLADLPALIEKLFLRLGADAQRVTLTRETLGTLVGYTWPGNFRQLVGTLKALIALADPGESLKPSALPAYLVNASEESRKAMPPIAMALDGETQLNDLELKAMQSAVEAANGNISLAAKRLGIHRSTLYRRLLSRPEDGK